VIAAKDPHGRHRPASIIKVLVADGVPERTAAQQVRGRNGRRRISRGHQGRRGRRPAVYTVNQLLHGLLMHSGLTTRRHALAMQLGRDAGRPLEKINVGWPPRSGGPRHPGGHAVGTGWARHEHLGLRHRPVLPIRLAKTRLSADIVATRTFDFPGHAEPPGLRAGKNDNQLLYKYPGARWAVRPATPMMPGQTFVGRGKPQRPAG